MTCFHYKSERTAYHYIGVKGTTVEHNKINNFWWNVE